jgi:hypothetical protein
MSFLFRPFILNFGQHPGCKLNAHGVTVIWNAGSLGVRAHEKGSLGL